MSEAMKDAHESLVSTPEERQQVQDLCTELDRWQAELEAVDHGSDRIRYFEKVKEFRGFLSSVENADRLYILLRRSGRDEGYKQAFRRANDIYMRGIEYLEAERISTKRAHANRTEDLIDRQEIKLRLIRKPTDLQDLEMADAKVIVCVGTGSMPETMMHFRDHAGFDATIIGLDNDTAAYNQGNALLSSLRWGDQLSIQHADGADFDYSRADIIHIAGFVSHKEGVLRQIAKTAPPHVQVTVENSAIGLMPLLYDDVNGMIPAQLYVANRAKVDAEYYQSEVLRLLKHQL